MFIKLFMFESPDREGVADRAAAVAGPVVDEAHVVVEHALALRVHQYLLKPFQFKP